LRGKYAYVSSAGRSSNDVKKAEKDFVLTATIAPILIDELDKRRQKFYVTYQKSIASETAVNDAYRILTQARYRCDERREDYDRARRTNASQTADLKAVEAAFERVREAEEQYKKALKDWEVADLTWKKTLKDYDDDFHAVLELPLD